MATPCPKMPVDAKLGPYPQYSPIIPTCDEAHHDHLGRPLFFGRHANKNTPLYVALDFEQYQLARKGMMIATGAAVVFGIALVVKMFSRS